MRQPWDRGIFIPKLVKIFTGRRLEVSLIQQSWDILEMLDWPLRRVEHNFVSRTSNKNIFPYIFSFEILRQHVRFGIRQYFSYSRHVAKKNFKNYFKSFHRAYVSKKVCVRTILKNCIRVTNISACLNVRVGVLTRIW